MKLSKPTLCWIALSVILSATAVFRGGIGDSQTVQDSRSVLGARAMAMTNNSSVLPNLESNQREDRFESVQVMEGLRHYATSMVSKDPGWTDRIDRYIEQLDRQLGLTEEQRTLLREGLVGDRVPKDTLFNQILDRTQLRTLHEDALNRRRKRVEDHANAELRSFSRKYQLTDRQQDQLFNLLVHFHPEYLPSMQANVHHGSDISADGNKREAVSKILYVISPRLGSGPSGSGHRKHCNAITRRPIREI